MDFRLRLILTGAFLLLLIIFSIVLKAILKKKDPDAEYLREQKELEAAAKLNADREAEQLKELAASLGDEK